MTEHLYMVVTQGISNFDKWHSLYLTETAETIMPFVVVSKCRHDKIDKFQGHGTTTYQAPAKMSQ